MTSPADFGGFGAPGRARRTWSSLSTTARPTRDTPTERVELAPGIVAVRWADTWSVWRRLSDGVWAEQIARDLSSLDACRRAIREAA